ncbi:MAG: hypothetical protein E7609_05545 [Ruminococcaceae bacterium]|nr:hypothetical protein [Oscillospiraceae bacterium]
MKEKIWGLLVHLSVDYSPAQKWHDAPLCAHFDEEVWHDCVEKFCYRHFAQKSEFQYGINDHKYYGFTIC